MAGRPIPSLFGIDAAERVLYLNSFAKSLGAAFRMAYLVLPPQLAQFDAIHRFLSFSVPDWGREVPPQPLG